MEKLINTGIPAKDPRRVYFLDRESGIKYDLRPDWQPLFKIIETGLVGPNGIPAVRIKETATGFTMTVSAELAARNLRIG